MSLLNAFLRHRLHVVPDCTTAREVKACYSRHPTLRMFLLQIFKQIVGMLGPGPYVVMW